jgi:hypothetical protein
VDSDPDFIQPEMLDPGSGINKSGSETLLETAMKLYFYSETVTVVYEHLAAGKMNTSTRFGHKWILT